ncbi:MAG TPA: NADH-quinone oxidoreductase subunit H, partial [Pirellulaceae bacterium]|nr:NADH-quinone oxidoreductase subunit H [Pirellulaceae bacterium]
GLIANLAGITNFILKTVFFVTVMIWVRWTLPRMRIDQVMTTCWKYCVPIACFCFVGVLGWQLADLPSLNDLAPAEPRGEVREHWAGGALAPKAAPPTETTVARRVGPGGEL